MTIGMWLAVLVVPVVAGGVALWFSERNRAIGSRPALTSLCSFVLLVVVTALGTPGGDLMAPAIGEIVSIFVCVAVYVVLRRRLASVGDPNERAAGSGVGLVGDNDANPVD
jgi:hypothetical protein